MVTCRIACPIVGSRMDLHARPAECPVYISHDNPGHQYSRNGIPGIHMEIHLEILLQSQNRASLEEHRVLFVPDEPYPDLYGDRVAGDGNRT